jgi:CHAT domain
MSLTPTYLSFLQDLRARLAKIQIELGADWGQFSQSLSVIADELVRASNNRNRDKTIRSLIAYVSASLHRSEQIRELLTEIYNTDHKGGVVKRTPTLGSKKDFTPPFPSVPGGTPSDDVRVDATTFTTSAEALATEIKSLSQQKADSKTRYFNAFFTTTKDSEQMVPVDEPLYQQAYYLIVEINPVKRGPSEDDIFVDSALNDAQKQGETLSLLVVASSRDFTITPSIKKIDLPVAGPSTKAIFSVKLLRADQRAFLQVEIFYRGHLLQAKRLEAFVLPDKDSDHPVSLKPFQSARLTFTTTERFSTETLTLIPERVLSIDVERDPRDQSVDLRFLDRTNGEDELAFYDTILEPQALGEAVTAVREKLKATVQGEERKGKKIEGFEWKKEGLDPMLLDWLPYLANVGRTLYRALLPENQRRATDDAKEKLKAALRPGATIQINPIAGRVTIPWALLYERPVFINPGQNRICAKYGTDGPECLECESQSDPLVICPYAFWGYRYAIEQLPGWVGNELPNYLSLLRRVSNGKPLLLNLNVWREFTLWKTHLKKLEDVGTIDTVLAEDLSTVANTWRSRSGELDILYFYTHGGTDQREPYLEVSDGRITSNTLESTLGKLDHNPLVFLNGCATGDYGPESFVSLIDDFRNAGACGVIGTECGIPELFAEEYATKLFTRLFSGERVGQAMLELRREFLIANKNPLALVYSLYASNEISLASPVNKSKN